VPAIPTNGVFGRDAAVWRRSLNVRLERAMWGGFGDTFILADI
jgi:hypothetical protein